MKTIYAYGHCSATLGHLRETNLQNLIISDNLDHFLAIQGNKQRLAVFHVQFPLPIEEQLQFENLIDHLVAKTIKVILICCELHTSTVNLITRLQNKATIFTCGFINDLKTKKWMYWFDSTSLFYKYNHAYKLDLEPYTPKEKYFDVLLGAKKTHRDIIYNYIKSYDLEGNVILTYLNDNDVNLPSSSDNRFIWETEGLEFPVEPINHTVRRVQYYGWELHVSQIIPKIVYKNSAYSVVAETNIENHYTFFTEKIVKPIIAERLFVVFANKDYLKNLKQLGFKTFDNVIDESYDSIDSYEDRFNAACEQIRLLCSQPQDKILKEIQPITEYNKKVMLARDWHGEYIRRLSQTISEMFL